MDRKIIALAIITTVVGLLYFNLAVLGKNQNNSAVISPDFETISSNRGTPPATTATPRNKLSSVILPIISGSEQSYAVVVRNLSTGETYNFNEHQPFEAGSLYKLWVMAEVEREISTGTLQDNQIISQSVPTLNYEFGIDPEDAEATSGTVNYTVSNAVNQMITVSDNYSALLLTEIITPSRLSLFASNNGFDESEFGLTNVPNTTASDVADFFQELYNGKLVNPSASEKMLDVLKLQQINDRIPKYLPDNITVAHKTGDIDNFSNDAGIVYTPKDNYVIVLLSRTNDPASAGEVMAKVSKAVYDYFTE